MKVRKGDKVFIRQGRDRGETGKVLRALPKEGKVIVEGVNMVKKRIRPTEQGEKGKTLEVPLAMPVSKVQLWCGSCKEPARAGARFEDDKKVRICKKCRKKI